MSMMISVLSQGPQDLLGCLSSGNSPTGVAQWPPAVRYPQMKFGKQETVHSWFCRCVNDFCGGDPRFCQLEENIGVFSLIMWDKGKLSGACIQALRIDEPLVDFYLADTANGHTDQEANYLRLDYHSDEFGLIWTHPVLHIHTKPSGPPHCLFDGGNSDNPIVAFFDYFFRQFEPEKWEKFARACWDRRCGERNMSDPESAVGEKVIDAFRESKRAYLLENAGVVGEVREACQEAFRGIEFPSPDEGLRQLSSFHAV